MNKMEFNSLKLRQLTESVRKKTLIPIEKIGQRLKEIRETLGMTQKQMAKKLGVRQPIISRIEENAEACSLKTIQKIVNVLECEFMGVIVSDKTLLEIIRKQAEKTSEKILRRTYSNMAMEKQSPTDKAYKYQLKKLIDEFIYHPNSELWEE